MQSKKPVLLPSFRSGHILEVIIHSLFIFLGQTCHYSPQLAMSGQEFCAYSFLMD